ncbi:hypothetical protein CSUI_001819 [Cystoisospora suis]|uniref:Uncharacterized protein n=1 Tax=Cystoisospora suis TaxID=483139 RepID=A0A2C6L735_9APIC|nr:hypothetical protein CSUI_001819 [Cystoisospora suis]
MPCVLFEDTEGRQGTALHSAYELCCYRRSLDYIWRTRPEYSHLPLRKALENLRSHKEETSPSVRLRLSASGSWLFLLFFFHPATAPVVLLWHIPSRTTCAHLQDAFACTDLSHSASMSRPCFSCTSPSKPTLVNISTAHTVNPSVSQMRPLAESGQGVPLETKAGERDMHTEQEDFFSSTEIEHHPLLLCRGETRLAVASEDNDRVFLFGAPSLHLQRAIEVKGLTGITSVDLFAVPYSTNPEALTCVPKYKPSSTVSSRAASSRGPVPADCPSFSSISSSFFSLSPVTCPVPTLEGLLLTVSCPEANKRTRDEFCWWILSLYDSESGDPVLVRTARAATLHALREPCEDRNENASQKLAPYRPAPPFDTSSFNSSSPSSPCRGGHRPTPSRVVKHCHGTWEKQRRTRTPTDSVALEEEIPPGALPVFRGQVQRCGGSPGPASPLSLYEAYRGKNGTAAGGWENEEDKRVGQESGERGNELKLAGALPSGWNVWCNSRFIVAMQKHTFREHISSPTKSEDEYQRDRERPDEAAMPTQRKNETTGESTCATPSAFTGEGAVRGGRKEEAAVQGHCSFKEAEEFLWREQERKKEQEEMILRKRGFYSIVFWRILGLYRDYSEVERGQKRKGGHELTRLSSCCRLAFPTCVSLSSRRSCTEQISRHSEEQGTRRRENLFSCEGNRNCKGDREDSIVTAHGDSRDPWGWGGKRTYCTDQSVGGQDEGADKSRGEEENSDGQAGEWKEHERGQGHERVVLVLSAKQRKITGRRGCACGVLLEDALLWAPCDRLELRLFILGHQPASGFFPHGYPWDTQSTERRKLGKLSVRGGVTQKGDSGWGLDQERQQSPLQQRRQDRKRCSSLRRKLRVVSPVSGAPSPSARCCCFGRDNRERGGQAALPEGLRLSFLDLPELEEEFYGFSALSCCPVEVLPPPPFSPSCHRSHDGMRSLLEARRSEGTCRLCGRCSGDTSGSEPTGLSCDSSSSGYFSCSSVSLSSSSGISTPSAASPSSLSGDSHLSPSGDTEPDSTRNPHVSSLCPAPPSSACSETRSCCNSCPSSSLLPSSYLVAAGCASGAVVVGILRRCSSVPSASLNSSAPFLSLRAPGCPCTCFSSSNQLSLRIAPFKQMRNPRRQRCKRCGKRRKARNKDGVDWAFAVLWCTSDVAVQGCAVDSFQFCLDASLLLASYGGDLHASVFDLRTGDHLGALPFSTATISPQLVDALRNRVTERKGKDPGEDSEKRASGGIKREERQLARGAEHQRGDSTRRTDNDGERKPLSSLSPSIRCEEEESLFCFEKGEVALSAEVLASTVGAGGRRLVSLVVSGSPAEVSEKEKGILAASRLVETSFLLQSFDFAPCSSIPLPWECTTMAALPSAVPVDLKPEGPVQSSTSTITLDHEEGKTEPQSVCPGAASEEGGRTKCRRWWRTSPLCFLATHPACTRATTSRARDMAIYPRGRREKKLNEVSAENE